MAKIYLVRHGTAAAGWGTNPDPPLSDRGQEEAAAIPAWFDRNGPGSPVTIVSSPMQRARETAGPLATYWRKPISIEPRITEVPTPQNAAADRRSWLRRVMQQSWPEIDDPVLENWRQTILSFLGGLTEDHVIFTHFVMINVAVGAAKGQDAVITFQPDTTSVTVLENRPDGSLRLIALGAEATTVVR